jgi:transcriptional regulator with XRE-family HTH domain
MTKLQIKNISDKEQKMRSLVLKFKNEYGIKQVYLANKINVSVVMFSLWLKGKRNLNENQLENLELILNKFNL